MKKNGFLQIIHSWKERMENMQNLYFQDCI